MTVTYKKTLQHTLKPSQHPYLTGAWTPNFNEFNARFENGDAEVIGEIPRDIDGIYVRNTENPLLEPLGNYHPFDGDGMIHIMSFRDGAAEYRNRFVQTKGFVAEQEAGEALWAGIANNPALSKRPGWGAQGYVKDSSSTDVVVHAGNILSPVWQCGDAYCLDPYTLEQSGTVGWAPLDGISAHPKVDEKTAELLFFNYSKHPPYQHYGVVDRNNKLVHYTAVPLPGPRLPHDMAFTENYSILVDLPLFWDPELLKQNRHHARFFPDTPTRFGIIPRYGKADEVRWFEAEPTYVLHWMNAYEEGDEIILHGYFQDEPEPPPLPGLPKPVGQLMANIDEHSFKSRLHRWRFNLKTGAVQEQCIDERILEFGSFNQQYAGRKTRYQYSTWTRPGWFLFSGLVKHDFETGESWSLPFGEQRYGSEAPFAPRINAQAEDDGYLVSFITDMEQDRSECVLIDARDIAAGPVCTIILPHRLCSGTHATWADGATVRGYQDNRQN
jgi:carotenoid cleavage dioxygenase